MADPQTANKFLSQPLRGSDVGTWDTPMNANSTILDASLGGTATITLSNSPVTLASNQYQNIFITFNGILTGNCAITFPNVGSIYTIQNLCTNSSAFLVTLQTTVGGGQIIGCPAGEPFDIMTDGTNVKFRNFGRIGTYWDYGGSAVPAWVSNSTVPPYLNCDGTSFSSATYPYLSIVLGGTTLPDARGRSRFALNQGTGRVTSGSSTGGVDGNTLLASGGAQTVVLSSQNMPPVPITDPGHVHGNPLLQTTPSGGGGTAVSANGTNLTQNQTNTAVTNITAGSTSPTNFSVMPPAYIGGLVMIRAG